MALPTPLLEREMEDVIVRCPELFIEPGLTFLRRQVIINGKRPDVLFEDGIKRHLLVEIQRERLDEDHVQRHVYYFWDYRKKYPETHPRLMFVANRVVPQHKDFFDYHGYEYREIPEPEFRRRATDCNGLEPDCRDLILKESPGVLPLSFQELLYQIQSERMTYCYKMLLLVEMVDHADSTGKVPLNFIAERFRGFFEQRAKLGKLEENPKRFFKPLHERTLSYWKTSIREQPVKRLGSKYFIDEVDSIRWAPAIWSQWSIELRKEIRDTAFNRLVDYFNRYAGGF
jgi:hypothetical protein